MKIDKKIIFGAIITFFVLTLMHYFSQRPLWVDENFVVENIQTSEYKDLFKPFKHVNTCPRVYLIALKWLGELFNYHVLALRFLPLVAGLGGFLLWVKIYRLNFKEDFYYLLAIFSIASSHWFVYYAAELKPYSMDVLVVALFYLFLRYQKEFEERDPSSRAYAVVCLLPLTLFFSYVSVFVFWIVSYNFIFIIAKNKKVIPLFVIYLVFTVLNFIFVYNNDIILSLKREVLSTYWNDYFLNTSSVGAFMGTLWEGIRTLSTHWFGNSRFFMQFSVFVIPFFVIPLFVYGFRSIIENRGKIYTLDALTAVFFSELVFLGAIHKYPFTGERVTLFFAPCVFYMIVKGIRGLKNVKILYNVFAVSYAGLLIMSLVNSFLNYLKLYQ